MRIIITRRESLDSQDGVSIFLVSLAQAFIELGHEIKVIAGLDSRARYERLLAPRLDIPIVPLGRLPSALAWLRATRIIDRFRPDIVIHSEAVPVPLPGVIVQAVNDLQRRSGILAPLWRSIRRFSMKRSDHIVPTTTELRDELVQDLSVPASRLTVIPKCIDRKAYRYTELSFRERAILHAGTLPYKDPVASIRAFGSLDDTSVRLYVTGDVTDAVEQERDALPAHLRDRVTLLGAVDGRTMRDLHSRVRIAAFPTRYVVPVGSATVMEAVASGTPIVGSTRLSRDVLVAGENGLVAPSVPDEMAAAFSKLLNDDELWKRLSQGAWRMAERFDAHRVAHAYLDLLRIGRLSSVH
jgi:glycosyltransferase involved in cell wall biosynthesis